MDIELIEIDNELRCIHIQNYTIHLVYDTCDFKLKQLNKNEIYQSWIEYIPILDYSEENMFQQSTLRDHVEEYAAMERVLLKLKRYYEIGIIK
ncbi:hypothetical protein [Citrobacter farmeri]|uniref:hypothetical protein n=1 Tax=Citrobacter farmeri TaxID=67824 RepID=UPI0019003234|nr:hypothetical protein [Citrobacter farmeri]MBJ9134406.1 hypothetical protein [Citrobacter farmeri]